MVNLLGEYIENIMVKIECLDDMYLYLYGKKVVKEKRKMGYIMVLVDKIDEVIEKVEFLGIWERMEEVIIWLNVI